MSDNAAFVYKNQLFVFQLVQYIHATIPHDAGTWLNVFDLEKKTRKVERDAGFINSEGCSFVMYKDRVLTFGGYGEYLRKINDTFSMSLDPPYMKLANCSVLVIFLLQCVIIQQWFSEIACMFFYLMKKGFRDLKLVFGD